MGVQVAAPSGLRGGTNRLEHLIRGTNRISVSPESTTVLYSTLQVRSDLWRHRKSHCGALVSVVSSQQACSVLQHAMAKSCWGVLWWVLRLAFGCICIDSSTPVRQQMGALYAVCSLTAEGGQGEITLSTAFHSCGYAVLPYLTGRGPCIYSTVPPASDFSSPSDLATCS